MEIWKKRGEKKNLSKQDALFLQAMEEHKEYWNLWESGNVYEVLNYKNEDPFFHITIHALVQKQIDEKEPPEVEKAYKHLLKKGATPHQATHSIGIILADEILQMMKEKTPFNEERYKKRRKKFLKM